MRSVYSLTVLISSSVRDADTPSVLAVSCAVAKRLRTLIGVIALNYRIALSRLHSEIAVGPYPLPRDSISRSLFSAGKPNLQLKQDAGRLSLPGRRLRFC